MNQTSIASLQLAKRPGTIPRHALPTNIDSDDADNNDDANADSTSSTLATIVTAMNTNDGGRGTR